MDLSHENDLSQIADASKSPSTARRPWQKPEVVCEAAENAEFSPLPSATEFALNPGS